MVPPPGTNSVVIRGTGTAAGWQTRPVTDTEKTSATGGDGAPPASPPSAAVSSAPVPDGPPPAVGGVPLEALRRRTAAVLVASQILGGFGVATGIALAALLAADVSGSESLSGLALTASVLGTAVLSLPLAALMSRRGRRPGLMLGYLIGAAGGTVVVLAAVLENFPLLLLGMAVFGAASSANLQSRFAAADLAAPQQRARAIAAVMWATTLGAVIGPNIAAPAGRSVSALSDRIPETAGPFLWAAVIFLLAALTVGTLLRPDPLLTARALAARPADAENGTDGGPGGRPDDRPDERSLRAGLAAISASPQARLALATVALSHTVMVSIMVMTPLDLDHHGAGIQLIGLVISGHIAGMYAFSPLVGWLADRLGRYTVVLGGVALLALAALLAGTAQGNHAQTAAGLFLLGLGWSAGLVGGSALLTDSVPPDERPAAQGLSDLAMNTCAGGGGALAGLVVSQAGYGWLTAAAAVLLVPVALMAVLTLNHPARARG
ncbi:MFS transporter [Streptomyces sp. YIM 98790]|uniref:MFS transporter n=1 Tax=Streptomyces sp. YIM 98790 TaxID=2689077 RepID=UPI00140DA147